MAHDGVLPDEYSLYGWPPMVSHDLIFLGWIKPDEIKTINYQNLIGVKLADINYPLTQQQKTDGFYRVAKVMIHENYEGDKDEYFLLEYHAATEYDKNFSNYDEPSYDKYNKGILVWHVKETQNSLSLAEDNYLDIEIAVPYNGFYGNPTPNDSYPRNYDRPANINNNYAGDFDYLDDLFQYDPEQERTDPYKGFANLPDGGRHKWESTTSAPYEWYPPANQWFFRSMSRKSDFFTDATVSGRVNNKITGTTRPSTKDWAGLQTYLSITNVQRVSNYITFDIRYNVFSGTLSQNTSIDGSALITSTLTVPSGVTLTILPGSLINFSSGTSLIINGTLNAVGTSSSGITFNRSGSSGTWNGIQFNNGSSGNLQYCNIYNATNGISLYNSSPQIKYSTIENCDIGIFCDYYSSPVLVGNNIRYNTSYGVRCNSFSSPNMTDNGYPGSNVIRNNYTGINTTYFCNPNLNGYMTYGNSIFDNTGDEVSALYNCSISAQRVYWGSSPTYYAYQSTIDYSNPLTTNPNPGRSVVSTPDDKISSIKGISLSIQADDLSSALDKQKDKKYDEAIPLFLEVFKSNKDALVGKYALIKIEECFTQAGKKDFLEYSKKELKPIIKTATETFVVLLELETHQLVNAGSYNKAMDNLFLIKEKYNLNEEIDKNTLYRIGVFYSYLYGDKKNAQKYFDELKTKYPKDDLVNEIDRWLNAASRESKNGSYIAIAQTGGDASASEEASVSVENYPNPFNPTTRISFTLPQKGNVKLRVFDLLGREVSILADGVYEAGKYEVSFDAGNLPSGVYFYNLTAGTNSITKKMLLIK